VRVRARVCVLERLRCASACERTTQRNQPAAAVDGTTRTALISIFSSVTVSCCGIGSVGGNTLAF